jgi:hypothetical protein
VCDHARNSRNSQQLQKIRCSTFMKPMEASKLAVTGGRLISTVIDPQVTSLSEHSGHIIIIRGLCPSLTCYRVWYVSDALD